MSFFVFQNGLTEAGYNIFSFDQKHLVAIAPLYAIHSKTENGKIKKWPRHYLIKKKS